MQLHLLLEEHADKLAPRGVLRREGEHAVVEEALAIDVLLARIHAGEEPQRVPLELGVPPDLRDDAVLVDLGVGGEEGAGLVEPRVLIRTPDVGAQHDGDGLAGPDGDARLEVALPLVVEVVPAAGLGLARIFVPLGMGEVARLLAVHARIAALELDRRHLVGGEAQAQLFSLAREVGVARVVAPVVAIRVASGVLDEGGGRDRAGAAIDPQVASVGVVGAGLAVHDGVQARLGAAVTGQDLDHAADAVVPVLRAHRPAHDLDPLDLVHRDQRPVRAAQVGLVHAPAVDQQERVAAVAPAVLEAARLHRVAEGIRGGVRDREARLAAQQVGHVARAAALDRGAVEHGHVARHVEHVPLRAVGADRDLRRLDHGRRRSGSRLRVGSRGVGGRGREGE